jgi:hypothetical protein
MEWAQCGKRDRDIPDMVSLIYSEHRSRLSERKLWERRQVSCYIARKTTEQLFQGFCTLCDLELGIILTDVQVPHASMQNCAAVRLALFAERFESYFMSEIAIVCA